MPPGCMFTMAKVIQVLSLEGFPSLIFMTLSYQLRTQKVHPFGVSNLYILTYIVIYFISNYKHN